MSSVRKIIVTALAAVAALAVALTITACGSVTLTGISITTPPSVTNYVVGDVFDTDGMVVTAEYDDGTTKEVTDYTVSPSKFDKAGKQTVVTIVSVLDDKDAIGSERIVIKDATFDSLILADWEVDKMGEESYSFTFSDWDLLDLA